MREIQNAYADYSNRITSKLLLLLLAVAFANVLSKGSYFLLAIGIAFVLMNYYHMVVPTAALPLLLFAWIYFAFTLKGNGLVNALQIFVCPLLWLMGYNLPEARRIKTIFTVMAVLAAGMAAHGLLNYGYNIAQGISMSGSTKLDIWTGEVQSATGQAALFSLFLASLTWLLFAQKKRWIRLLSLAVYFVMLLYAVQLGSRSFLLLSVAVFVVGMVSFITQRGEKKYAVRMLLGTALLLAALLLAYRENAWGLRDYIESSYLFRRMSRSEGGFFDVTANSRWRYKRIYLQNLFRFPWGGNHLQQIAGSYAHDLWLDMFDEAGILALIVLIWYTLAALIRILRVRRTAGLAASERAALLCYGAVIYAQFLAEPIWQGSPMLLYAFVMIDGMLAKYLRLCSGGRQGPKEGV